MKNEPLRIINALRESDRYIEIIFTQGACYKFHLFLKTIFPEAEPYLHVEGSHIISKIGNQYYDITGELEGSQISFYNTLTDEDLRMAKEWSFSKHMFLALTECSSCNEPIIIP